MLFSLVVLMAVSAANAAALSAAKPPPLLVVTTASSLEGVAFCRHALRTPGEYRVRALVRNPASARAAALAELGAEVCVADNHDTESLERAFAGAHGIYACTTWSGSSFAADGTVVRSDNLEPARTSERHTVHRSQRAVRRSPLTPRTVCVLQAHLEESEYQQGLNILRAAETTESLQHFVLQSMHKGGRPHAQSTPAPLHHSAKWRQEEALMASSSLPCPWSVLRQPTYLENFANDETAAEGTQLRLLKPGVVSGLLAPDEELTVISVDDLGALAVAMLRAGPSAWAGRVLTAGSERISGRSLASAATRLHGTAQFEYRQVPRFVLEFFIPVEYPKQLQRWLSLGGNDEGARPEAREAVFGESRALHPEMKSVDDFLIAQGVRDLPTPWWQQLRGCVAGATTEAERGGERRALGRRSLVGGALAAGASAIGAGQWLTPARPSLPAAQLLASRDRAR